MIAFIKWLLSNGKKEPKGKVCCLGCKYLDYWNDGSALCIKICKMSAYLTNSSTGR